MTAATVVTAPSETLFMRIGGEAGVTALVTSFVKALLSRDDVAELRALYLSRSLERYQIRLAEYLCGWLGGPALYQERHGLPMLREGHRNIPISRQLMVQWCACMHDALEATVADPALRLSLFGVFLRMAESLVNQKD